jgi:N-acetylglucosaminyltransferase
MPAEKDEDSAGYVLRENPAPGPDTQTLFLEMLDSTAPPGRPYRPRHAVGGQLPGPGNHSYADTEPIPAITSTLAAPVLASALKEHYDDIPADRVHPRGLRRARDRASRPRRRPVGSPDVAALTLTVIIPAHNEAAGLPETLRAIGRQTVSPNRVIVADDGSEDGTGDVACALGAEVVRREQSTGSKSANLNNALLECDTDLVLNIDGDTVIGDDYVERIKAPFTDPLVAVASGIVQVWNPKGALQRGRQVEYLLGQHLYRPVQHLWASPTVCPGAACAYRREDLAAAGGFPDGTIAEDMDFTWRMMLAGKKAVYVAGAECYAIDPKTPAQLRTQLWRWMSGYFQCVRTHWRDVLRKKKVLALLVLASMWDILSLPFWLVAPLTLAGHGRSFFEATAFALFGTDLLVTVPVVVTGAVRRGINPFWVLSSLPFIWVMRAFNFWYAGKAMLYELVLVPCEWKTSLSFFKKGH